MVNKKGFIRTMEAVVAVMITLAFVLYVVPQKQSADDILSFDILTELSKDQTFRQCTFSGNVTCLTNMTREKIPGGYEFILNLSSNPYTGTPELPTKKIVAESIYITANATHYNSHIIRLYYWPKS